MGEERVACGRARGGDVLLRCVVVMSSVALCCCDVLSARCKCTMPPSPTQPHNLQHFDSRLQHLFGLTPKRQPGACPCVRLGLVEGPSFISSPPFAAALLCLECANPLPELSQVPTHTRHDDPHAPLCLGRRAGRALRRHTLPPCPRKL
jgi:hypothetical protein